MARGLRATRPVVLHAHGYKAAVAVRLAGMLSPGTPRVLTLHNLWPATVGAWELALLRWIAKGAALIAVSPAVAESVRPAVDTNVQVIGNGVELSNFACMDPAGSRAALGLDREVPVVAYLGRLTREKGADLALEATRRLWERGVPARLLVAGDGPERATLVASAGPGAIFLGEREDVPRILAACDLVVIPSRREGQSIVALEAMAAGRPIVATRVGGLAALAEGAGGVVVPPDDPIALADALLRLLKDPNERAGRAASGRAYVETHASAEATAAAVAALYDRLRGRGTMLGEAPL
jgi:glycosyltransferase involved in cell wall biosynthesis